ncbi:Exopolysaccharide biosynthesis protein YbjH [Paracoccus halophilus]|uniref:Exopolysaccharide biosynthesis protein YbjH n=1 Tax=Paracoccus halophilus TaxID=376733 RepID=A0A099F2V6_9RHOB|nr:YjbH domain-containing protein [Paracoccus halophilus]KGJ04789.1 membrane protein [Paracoccus halophilus]SFA51210.1 Exopolysaccharide biosynthesis protein YbjH [Paracoccus halophilus]
MRAHSTLTRRLLASALPVALLIGQDAAPGRADPLIGRTIGAYGLPGAIDTPTAEMLPDSTLGATVAYSNMARRNSIVFQALPRLTVVLRYSRVESTEERRGYIWDRSFDLRYQFLDEDPNSWRPAVAIGLQDFLGTGIFSAEYLVATKTINPRLRISAGLGWGRLAQQGSIGNPFGHRPDPDDEEGGKPNVDQWFRGDVAPFVSASWQATDNIYLTAEYSGDRYACETGDTEDCPRTPWLSDEDELKNRLNLGLTYQIGQNYQLTGYVLGGKQLGVQFTVAMDPRQSPFPSGTEKAPAPVRPRVARNADPEGWSGAWSADPTAHPAIQKALGDALADEGQVLESMALDANRAEVRIRNNRYIQQAEAIGRTARLMTRALPPSVETLVITSSQDGMPTSSVTLRRSDVERLENTEASQISEAAVLSSADPRPGNLVYTPGLFPRFSWSLRPYVSTSLFDPDEPFRYEVGAQLSGEYELMPGLILSGSVRQRAFGNKDQDAPGSLTVGEYKALDTDYNSNGVPRVRSDSRMYSGDKGPTVPRLTLAWYAKPTEDIYSRVTVGLLERAFGGVSGEVLWWPSNSRLALGAEINRVKKRDFRDVFGFRDYEVTTGHVSAYYDFQNGISTQLDIGKYLAGDKGATLTVTREFANGWRVGAWVTKTDMSTEDFGEGSFDKGVTLSIPLAWGTGQPSLRRVGGNIRSLSRDGGTRVSVRGRLYDTIRDSQSGQINQGWGRFWR